MRFGDVAGLALGALRAHRLRTRMTAFAMAIGVCSVLVLTALGESAREWVVSRFAAIGSNILIAIPGRTETRGGPPLKPATTKQLTLDDMKAIPRRLPGALAVVPIVMGEGLITCEGRGRAGMVIGSTHEFLKVRNVDVALGRHLPEIDPDEVMRVCVIGRKIQKELFEERNPLGARIKIGDHPFRVIGVIGEEGKSMTVDMDDLVIVPVATAMQIFNSPGLFRIMVQVSAFADMEVAERRLVAILKERHDGEEDFTILTPGAVAATLGNIVGIITMGLTGIAAVSLAVAGIGVMNVMVVSVTERTSEIGLMKAVGASNRQVLALFLAEAVAIALMGGTLGVAAGLALTWIAYRLYPTIPFHVPAWALYLALGVSFAVGIVFGILPAIRAARLQPLEALRRKV